METKCPATKHSIPKYFWCSSASFLHICCKYFSRDFYSAFRSVCKKNIPPPANQKMFLEIEINVASLWHAQTSPGSARFRVSSRKETKLIWTRYNLPLKIYLSMTLKWRRILVSKCNTETKLLPVKHENAHFKDTLKAQTTYLLLLIN